MKHLFLILMAIVMLSSACSEDVGDPNGVVVDPDRQEQGASHWGNKEPIPYSVDNMRLALQELQANRLSKSSISVDDIQATHIYVKFIPKDDEELMLLKSDSVLDVVPIPYDNDLSNFNGVYHDPSVPADKPTYQYSVVEVGYELPDVEYAVLDSIYMPDMVSSQLSKASFDLELWESLERKAIEMTGFDYNVSLSKATKREGIVRSYKDGTYTYPVPNVRVHINFSVRKDNAYTDSDGKYTMSKKFSCQVHTHVYFENSNYTMYKNGGNDVLAYYRGRLSGYTVIHFTKEQATENMASMVAWGAYQLYDNDVVALPCPPYCKVYLYPEYSISSNGRQGYFRYNNGQYIVEVYDNQQAYSNTYECAVDQLSKACLRKLSGSSYDGLGSSLCDAWGLGVGWYLTQKVFGTYKPRSNKSYYNNLIVDLMDDDNSTHDKVSGYSIKQMVSCLMFSESVSDFKEALKRLVNNPTKQYLDELFLYWFNC